MILKDKTAAFPLLPDYQTVRLSDDQGQYLSFVGQGRALREVIYVHPKVFGIRPSPDKTVDSPHQLLINIFFPTRLPGGRD